MLGVSRSGAEGELPDEVAAVPGLISGLLKPKGSTGRRLSFLLTTQQSFCLVAFSETNRSRARHPILTCHESLASIQSRFILLTGRSRYSFLRVYSAQPDPASAITV
jgi:hypothetical protein